MPPETPLSDMLFKEWDLGAWANVLEVVGTGIALASFFLGLFINKQVKILKRKSLFQRTVQSHITSFESRMSNINFYLNDYNGNRRNIHLEINDLRVELDILHKKLSSEESFRVKNLKKIIVSINRRGLVERQDIPQKPFFKTIYKLFKADEDDVWNVYSQLRGVIITIREVQNNTPPI